MLALQHCAKIFFFSQPTQNLEAMKITTAWFPTLSCFDMPLLLLASVVVYLLVSSFV